LLVEVASASMAQASDIEIEDAAALHRIHQEQQAGFAAAAPECSQLASEAGVNVTEATVSRRDARIDRIASPGYRLRRAGRRRAISTAAPPVDGHR
jgi:hypothetical protein